MSGNSGLPRPLTLPALKLLGPAGSGLFLASWAMNSGSSPTNEQRAAVRHRKDHHLRPTVALQAAHPTYLLVLSRRA